MKLSKIKKNPENPRFIKDEKFEQLKKSIVSFPEMLALRPIVVDENSIAIGGNMRYLALVDLRKNGFEEIFPDNLKESQIEYRKKAYEAIKSGNLLDEWVKQTTDLTPEQRQEFIVKDNNSYGSWDFDLLANNFNVDDLLNWGLDLPADLIELPEFKEYDESVESEVAFVECPECGHKFPK